MIWRFFILSLPLWLNACAHCANSYQCGWN